MIDLSVTLDIWLLTKYLLSREGRWKVVAKFDQGKENIFSREFEVKKYGKSFIRPSDSARFFCWSVNSISPSKFSQCSTSLCLQRHPTSD